MSTSTTLFVSVLVALALVSGCTASLRRANSAKTPGNALHQSNLDGKKMLAALLQDASIHANAEVTGRQGHAGSSLQYLYRQASDGCKGSPGIAQCISSCDPSNRSCTSTSSSGCQAATLACSLPGCCASGRLRGEITVTMQHELCACR
jgi:hypothetical protein